MKNNLSNLLKSLTLFCAVVLLFNYESNAQENGIYELNASSQFSRATASKSKTSDTRTEFYNLSQKLHPTAYLANNKLKNTYGDDDVVKLTLDDVASLNLIKQDKGNFDNVELITITLKSIADLSTPITLSNDSGLSKLKYVYIRCYFDCNNEQIKSFVKNISNSNVRVFYTSVRPS
ncbi:hypothetical protein [Algibacter lectus]|nr:hypothetical protein [Algibacter lectus]MWW23422.1 hypothetical protein [Algibacter lectus]